MSPECEETGERCALVPIELDPENVEAWNLFWDLKHLGSVALDLRSMELSAEDADLLLARMRQIAETRQRIEFDQLKRAEQEMKRGRYRGR